MSQAADELVSLSPIEGAADRVRATIRLRCGCIVELAIAEARIVQRPDGRSFPVGKYPCPLGHPAG